MSSLRIAYVCANPSYRLTDPSGYATHIRELSNGLGKLGHRVSLLIPHLLNKGSDPPTAPRPHPLRKYFPSFAWNLLKDVRRARFLGGFERSLVVQLDTEKPAIIYERLGYEGSAASRWAISHEIPIVFEIHDPILEETHSLDAPHPLMPLFRRRVRRAMTFAAGFVVVSQALKCWLVDTGINAQMIHVIHNGVNLDKFSENIPCNNFNNWKPKGDQPVIGFVGSALHWHALPHLIKTFAQVIKEVPAHLLLVGLSDTSPQLRASVKDLGITEQVSFLGTVPHDQVPALIACLDIAVLPGANPYQNPIKIFEYGAMGKAVVAPRTDPIQEILSDGENALLFSLGSMKELQEALLKLLRNPDLRHKLGQSLMQKVRTNHGWQHAAQKLADALLATEKASPIRP